MGYHLPTMVITIASTLTRALSRTLSTAPRLSTRRRSQLTTCCLLLTARGLLLTTYCSTVTTFYLLLTTYRLPGAPEPGAAGAASAVTVDHVVAVSGDGAVGSYVTMFTGSSFVNPPGAQYSST